MLKELPIRVRPVGGEGSRMQIDKDLGYALFTVDCRPQEMRGFLAKEGFKGVQKLRDYKIQAAQYNESTLKVKLERE